MRFVARIVTEEMDMDAARVIASLLMDIPGYKGREKPNLESLRKTISGIVQNVCQIAELNLQKVSLNSENFIQLLLYHVGGYQGNPDSPGRRLNLMRMISRLPQSEQLQVSEETSRLYAPPCSPAGDCITSKRNWRTFNETFVPGYISGYCPEN
jgi:(p)ppGpp synthase/HD superfamily hydrolase